MWKSAQAASNFLPRTAISPAENLFRVILRALKAVELTALHPFNDGGLARAELPGPLHGKFLSDLGDARDEREVGRHEEEAD